MALKFVDTINLQIKHFLAVDYALSTEIIIGITVVLITALLLLILIKRSKSSKRTVLLVGLCEAGKTLIFSLLVHRRHVATHTSMKENAGYYRVNNGRGKKTLFLVDVPGYERLRYKFLDQFKKTTLGLIFLIDSSTIQTNLKDAAEFLYNILGDKDFTDCTDILIVCNKQDIELAKSAKLIKTLLEKEINVLRITRSASLEYTEKSSNNNTFLGKRGKDFEFSHLHPLKVEFVECSASIEDDRCKSSSLRNVEEWLNKIA